MSSHFHKSILASQTSESQEIEKLHAKMEALETKEVFYKHKIKDLNHIVQKFLDQIRKLHNKSKKGELNAR